MQFTLNLLYSDAMENLNDTLRLLDSDELSHYQECTALLSHQNEKFAIVLGQEAMKKYTDILAERDDFLQQAIFRRGLALGLRLSALAIQ